MRFPEISLCQMAGTNRSVDGAQAGKRVDEGKGGCLLFLGLSAGTGYPTENDAVGGIYTSGEGAHGKVTSPDVGGGAGKDKARDGNNLGDSDVPGALMYTAQKQKLAP